MNKYQRLVIVLFGCAVFWCAVGIIVGYNCGFRDGERSVKVKVAQGACCVKLDECDRVAEVEFQNTGRCLQEKADCEDKVNKSSCPVKP